MTKKLIKNQWKCLYCGDVIESKHQHDFKWCEVVEIDDEGNEL